VKPGAPEEPRLPGAVLGTATRSAPTLAEASRGRSAGRRWIGRWLHHVPNGHEIDECRGEALPRAGRSGALAGNLRCPFPRFGGELGPVDACPMRASARGTGRSRNPTSRTRRVQQERAASRARSSAEPFHDRARPRERILGPPVILLVVMIRDRLHPRDAGRQSMRRSAASPPVRTATLERETRACGSEVARAAGAGADPLQRALAHPGRARVPWDPGRTRIRSKAPASGSKMRNRRIPHR